MHNGILQKAAAFLLVICVLLCSTPAHAIEEQEEQEVQSTEQKPSTILPESGYIQPGAVTISWEAAAGATQYTLTLDNVLTERDPDLVYTTSRLSRRVNLSVSPAWRCTLTAESAEGVVQTQTAEYCTAVLYDGRILQVALPAKSISLDLAGTRGVFVPVDLRSAEPSASPKYEETEGLPQIEEIRFSDNAPFYAVAEANGFRLFADDANPRRTYQTEVYVRLAETETFLPAGTLIVRTLSTEPDVSVQAVTLDLFANENSAALSVAASEGEVLSIRIDETKDNVNPHPEWFSLTQDGGLLQLSEQGVQTAEAGNVSLRLWIQVDGFEQPVSAVCRVALTDSAPSIQLEKKTISLHPDGREAFTLRFSLTEDAPTTVTGVSIVPMETMTAQEQKTYALNDRFTAWYDGNDGIRILPTAAPSNGQLLLRVWFAGSSRPVRFTLRVRTSIYGTFSLSASSLKLYRTPFVEESSTAVAYTMQPINLATGTIRVMEVDSAKNEQPLHSLDWKLEDGKLVFTANDETRAGNLHLRIYAENASGYRTVRIQVIDRMPALKIKTAGKLDLSDQSKLLTLSCTFQNTTRTLGDAESIRLSDERLEITTVDANALSLRWLGGLTENQQETCTVTVVFADGLTLQSTFVYTPTRSTVKFAFACEEITVTVGEQVVLPLTVNKTGKEIEWNADGDCVRLEDGVLTALLPGQATVTASAGQYSDTLTVWCTEESLPADGTYRLTANGLALTASDIPTAAQPDGSASQRWRLTHKGNGTFELRAEDGRVLAAEGDALFLRYPAGNANERFRVENGEGGAAISPDGQTGSLTLGEAGVTLEKGRLTLTAESALWSILLQETELELCPDEVAQLSPTTNPAGLANELLFRSEDENVATVNASGQISAHAPGTTVITVYHPQSSVSAQVTVRVRKASTALPDGVYRIQSVESRLFLTVQNDGNTNGTPVCLHTQSEQRGQLFRTRTVDGKTYLYPLCSQNGNGKVLDVYRGNTSDAPIQAGCRIDVWSFGDEAAQAWILSGQEDVYTLSLAADRSLCLTGSGQNATVEKAEQNGQSWKFLAVESTDTDGSASVWVNPLAAMTTTQAFGGGFSSSSAYWGHLAWDGVGATDVMAAADGVVQNILSTAQSSGHGNIVLIRHTSNGRVFYSSYSHLRDGSIRVSVGQKLRAGTVLGEMGATGNVTGRHLHFCVFSGASKLPYSYCGRTFQAVYRDYTGNYRLRYYDPITAIQTNGELISKHYYG